MKACVASITGLSSPSGTLGWTVDDENRLTNEAVTSGSRSSGSVTGTNAYDLAANLTTLRGTSGITHNSNNQITPSTGQWAYDGMGNPTKFRGRDCTYDLPGRMATMRDGNNWSMGYKYRSDGLIGSRAKTVYIPSRNGQWTPLTHAPTYYQHDGGEPLFELATGSNFTTVNAINVRGPDGLVARKFGSNWTYYTFDQQGSVSQRLNSSGVVQSSSVYDAYGKETNNGSPSDPFGYNAQWGYWLDRETGMYLCQARWYDPVTARWVNRDPIGYAGGANLYGYCGGGPVGWADPWGLQRLVILGQPKPGEIGLADSVLANGYILSKKDRLLTYPTQDEVTRWLRSGQFDEAVAVGHGGAKGVTMKRDRNGGATDRFSPELVRDALRGKKMKHIYLEACSQMVGGLGDSWVSVSQAVTGYDENTDTFGRLFGFDPPWGGSAHPRTYTESSRTKRKILVPVPGKKDD